MAQKQQVMPPVASSVSKSSSFPSLTLLFAVVVIAVAVVDYFKIYTIPPLAIDVVLLVSGLKLLYWGVEKGFEKRRKEMFKKYI
ncbi:hypothetical protein HYV86_01875 [Candidatus Woesearchaeota archaeon]|nr:hypothetical protein [Candidatus Woesearchaeota archaeon]